MEIRDLEYLNSEVTTEVTTLGIEGGAALAISSFSGTAFGSASLVTTVVKNQAVNVGGIRFAFSSVSVTSVASGSGAIAQSSASSYSQVSR